MTLCTGDIDIQTQQSPEPTTQTLLYHLLSKFDSVVDDL